MIAFIKKKTENHLIHPISHYLSNPNPYLSNPNPASPTNQTGMEGAVEERNVEGIVRVLIFNPFNHKNKKIIKKEKTNSKNLLKYTTF